MTFQDSYDPATDDPATDDPDYRNTLMAHNRVRVFQDYGGPNLDWKPDFTELLGLMLRTETTLGASLDKQPTPEFSPLDGYNGVDDVMGTPYESYAVSFAFSRSPQETAYIKRRIDQAQKHQTVFSQSGALSLLGTGLVAGMLEPLNLLFAAAPGVMTSVGKSLLQSAKTGARIGAVQASVVEAALHHFQPDRTLEQSMLDISFSAGAGASLLPMFAIGKKLYGRMEMDHPELLRAMDESLREEFRTGTTTGFTGHINPGWRPERPGERRWAPGINNPATPGARVHPDMPSRGSDATPTGFRAYGAERISNALSKRDLVLNGEISSSARAMENLVTTPSYLQKNFENVATDLPVARAMKTWDATLAEFLSDINHAHTAYRMRIAGRKGEPTLREKAFIIAQDVAQRVNHPKNLTGAPSRADPDGPLSIIRFREEVTATLRRAETDGKIKHDIPEIEQMAQRVRDTNDYIFSEAVTAGVMKQGDYRPNFVPRMWDQPMVFKQEAELKEIIMRWQRENLPEELRDSSKQLSSKLSAIHTSIDGIENMSTEALQSHKGIFKERSINVPDEIIADFLVGDIDHIMRSYVRLASADIEISRKFGSISMEKTFEAIRREAADMDARAASGVKHQKIAEKHIEYLEAYRDILRGVYQLPTDPYSIPSRTARLVLDFNTWTMLGGATLSSVPDIGRSVMMNGLEPTFHGVRALIKDFDTWKVAAKEVKTAGTALDMMLQTRALALAMTGDLPQRYTKIERVAGYMTNGFFIANMLSPWNAFMKQAVGVSTSHRILELVKQDLNGTISAKNRARLRAAYISLEDSRLIDNAFNKHGETVNGLKIPNTERWAEDPTRPTRTDEPAAEPTPGLPPRTDETPASGGRAEADNVRAQRVFRAALARDVDQAIVTPEAGDLPLFTYKIWGRILAQYKSFIASAFHKVLIPGMQMRDAQTMMGMMMMVFLGGLVTMIRDKQNGVPVADEPLEFIVDGIDQSGVTSWFFVANNAIEAWSDNRYGLRPSLGVGPWWSTSMRWKMGSVLGPSASQAMRIGDIMGDVLSGDADWRTRRSAWRLVPGNNLLQLNLGNVIQFNNWMDQIREFATPDMKAAERNTFSGAEQSGFYQKTADRMAQLLTAQEKPDFDRDSLNKFDQMLMRTLDGNPGHFIVQDEDTGKRLLMEISPSARTGEQSIR